MRDATSYCQRRGLRLFRAGGCFGRVRSPPRAAARAAGAGQCGRSCRRWPLSYADRAGLDPRWAADRAARDAPAGPSPEPGWPAPGGCRQSPLADAPRPVRRPDPPNGPAVFIQTQAKTPPQTATPPATATSPKAGTNVPPATTTVTDRAEMSLTGLVFSPDGRHIYLSNAGGNVWAFPVDDYDEAGKPAVLPLPAAKGKDHEVPAGLAVSPDGCRLYVAGNLGNRLYELEAATGKLLRSWDTGVAPYDIVLAGTRAYVSNLGGRRPLEGDLTAPAGKGTTVRVDPVRHIADEGSVTVIDLAAGRAHVRGPGGLARLGTGCGAGRRLRRGRQHRQRYARGDRHPLRPGGGEDLDAPHAGRPVRAPSRTPWPSTPAGGGFMSATAPKTRLR